MAPASLVIVACLAASLSGFCCVASMQARFDARMQKRNAKASLGWAAKGADGRLPQREDALPMRLLHRASRTSHASWMKQLSGQAFWGLGFADAQRLLNRAGVSDVATVEGMRIMRVQCTGIAAVAGAFLGAVFSSELSLVLAMAGVVGGYCWPLLELRRRAAERTADMERHLSEMLEVVVLGLRSGLSFERSFRLYPKYFGTELARSMSRVAGQWEIGLVSREDALRALEREYDSVLLSRAVGSMVRSLRFGTSVAESLESAATEAREVHRARLEERVAKVAVKMMLPVGALILPAMLLLVLGPVLLELVQGF